MLRPSKHSHPDETVLAATTVLLNELHKKRVVPYEELKNALGKRSEGVEFLFNPGLSVLYLLGLIDYRPTADVFEYLGDGK